MVLQSVAGGLARQSLQKVGEGLRELGVALEVLKWKQKETKGNLVIKAAARKKCLGGGGGGL